MEAWLDDSFSVTSSMANLDKSLSSINELLDLFNDKVGVFGRGVYILLLDDEIERWNKPGCVAKCCEEFLNYF